MDELEVMGLDEIMADAPAPVVEDASQEQEQEESSAEQNAQVRDEAGKFAKQDEKPADAQPTDQDAQAVVEEGEKGKVPIQALHASREKEKSAKDEADKLRREMAEMRGQISVLTQQRQAPEQPKEEVKPINYWDDPEGFIEQQLTPVQQQFEQQLQQTRFAFSQRTALAEHGQEVVTAAEQAMQSAIHSGKLNAEAVKAHLAKSTDPVGDVIRWHNNTPEAQEQAMREKLKAEILAEIGQEKAPPAQPNNANTSTAKPLTKLPQSLNKLPGSGNSAGAELLSDGDILNTALGG